MNEFLRRQRTHIYFFRWQTNISNCFRERE